MSTRAANLVQQYPAGGPLPAGSVGASVVDAARAAGLRFGDQRLLDLFHEIGRRMLSPALVRAHPEVGPLGMFLRRSGLGERVRRVEAEARERRVPRGLAVHIPPANVPTLLCYSWALAAAAGNANIVRIPGRALAEAHVVLTIIGEVLNDAPEAVRLTQRLVSYERNSTATGDLSALCHLRVLWGGDATVTALRALPLPPGAKEVTFPDRSSFTVISAPAWLAAPAAERRVTARGFYRDTYWYDQSACSSPRTVYWVGPATDADAASADFERMLAAEVTQRNPAVDAAMAVQKRVSTYGLAIRGAAREIRFTGNALAVVDLVELHPPLREWGGAGTFAIGRVARLEDLVPLVDHHHQTVTHFGFSAAELHDFVDALAGRGVDRLVPIGRALAFDAVWDGYDLLHEFSRAVTVATEPPS